MKLPLSLWTRAAGALLAVAMVLTSACALETAATEPAPTPAPHHDYIQLVFDASADSNLTLERVTQTTQQVVELAIDSHTRTTVEFWVLDTMTARLIYSMDATCPSLPSRRAEERFRERTIGTAVQTVTAIMEGVLQARPRTTPLVAGLLRTVKWRMPGTTALVIIVGSDLMETSDGVSFEGALPSEAAFLDWAATRGVAKGALAGVTVFAVYTDTTRLDARYPGRSVRIERLWTRLLRDVGGATDVTVIAGPFQAREFTRRRRGRSRKTTRSSRLRRLWQWLRGGHEDALVTRVVDRSSISPPTAGATLDDHVCAELGVAPRAFDPAHPDDAQAAADQLLGPRIDAQEQVVAEVQKRRDLFAALPVYWFGLTVTMLGECFLAYTLLSRLGIDRAYAAVLSIGISMTFVAVLMLLRATKRRMVIYVLCVVILVGLGSLAVIRMDDLATVEETSPLFNAAVVFIMVIAAAGLPALIELIATRYVQAAQIARELASEKRTLADLVERRDAAVAYEAAMRDACTRYDAMHAYMTKLVRAQYPNAFRQTTGNDTPLSAPAVVPATILGCAGAAGNVPVHSPEVGNGS